MPEHLTLLNKTAFETFCSCGDVVEVRILGAFGKGPWESFAKGTVSGYFDDHSPFVKAVRATNKAQHDGIYFTLQRIDPRLIGRAFNKLKASNLTTSDNNVRHYRWILVDIDPVRPSGISSSDSELAEAQKTAAAVISWLSEKNFPEPIQAMSGNGIHLLYGLNDTPVTEAVTRFIKSFLLLLAARFNSDTVSIDTSVFNPARICRLYGTTARKGDSVPAGPNREARPHRGSYIVNLPEPLETVSEAALKEIFQLFPKEPEPRPVRNALLSTSTSKLDVARYLDHYGVRHRIKEKGGSTFYCLEHCVFDQNHRGNEAAIIQADSGKLTYQCFHSSCQGRQWRAARELISGTDKLINFME